MSNDDAFTASRIPTAAVADDILTRADQLGHGHRDIAAVREILGQLAATGVAAH